MSNPSGSYPIEEGRLTQPIVDTFQNLRRLGLSPEQIHEAIRPMVALVSHLDEKRSPPARVLRRTA